MRIYEEEGIRLQIPPGIFHPKFFYSTRLLLQYVCRFPLYKKYLLEPGAGSGLISFLAAQKGAKVTATDINPLVVEYLRKNGEANHLSIQVILSDMFENIPMKKFDFIAINPPYYQKSPVSFAEYAWYCGENGEYFSSLFKGLKDYVHDNTIICMVLCEGCNLTMINRLANDRGWNLHYVFKKKDLLENSFVIRIEPKVISHMVKPEIDNDPDLFDNVYLRLRNAEQRIYSDHELSELPKIRFAHPHYGEWLLREHSAQRLINYLQKKRKPLEVLEVGSGNGWLSNALSGIPGSNVCGIEINTTEFRQAERVFGQKPNLKFIQMDINQMKSNSKRYDVIVMAASLQYFPSVKNLFENFIGYLLKPSGEVHIIDTPFYKRNTMDEAVKRTEQYYNQLGFPEMIPYYFHHSFSELKPFRYRFVRNLKLCGLPVFHRLHSFFWVCIKNV